MKYGKALADQLDSLPEEWRQQAIEYRKVRLEPRPSACFAPCAIRLN